MFTMKKIRCPAWRNAMDSTITKRWKSSAWCYYQPIAHSSALTDLSSHYEILIRMLDESGNLIPQEFSACAERTIYRHY
jgi:EAL domain-containing protein (putative c-di-GMP-specific phosphodiesterase class I)